MSKGYYAMPKHYESQNYMWCTKDQLGAGAGGTVYAGYGKKEGMKVAVKEFKQTDYITVHQQEIEVLKALPSHRNIVRLFAAENETTKHNAVLVMELCTGRSLYEVIESPENAFGLCEEEFITVMIDTAEGLAHLRRHNIIHRDIKPGNIMRCKNRDGSFSFKLTDFGAARELAEGDRFVSLYGTEEYLHPDLYEKALVNQHKPAQFTAKVDLWSIGATLYHAATGRLPFQSYSQRKDRNTMFLIISKKEKGVISGVQKTAQGVIEWNTSLPEDTRLSKGLKLLLEPILQGVLETEANYIMEFDTFFQKVKSIGRMKALDVFVVSKCECLKVYYNPLDQKPFSSLKRAVCEQCAIRDAHYMDLYFDNLPIREQSSVAKVPLTTEDRPIFVYGGQVEEHLKPVVMRQVPRLPEPKDLKLSIQFAKECKKLVHYQKHVALILNRKFAMMHQAASCVSHMLRKDQEAMESLFKNVSTAFSSVRSQLYHGIGSLWQLRELLNTINPQVQAKLTDFIRSISEDKQMKERDMKVLEERYEPISLKVHSMREVAKSDRSDEWDPNYLSEQFRRSQAIMVHQCCEAGEDSEAIVNLAKSASSANHSTPNYHYEMKVLGFTKNQLHRRLSETQEHVNTWNASLTALHKKLHGWLNATVVMRTDAVSMTSALERELQLYGEESQALQKWMVQSDTKLKDMAKQIALVVQNHVEGEWQATSSPNAHTSLQRRDFTEMFNLFDRMSASTNESMTSLHGNMAHIDRRTKEIVNAADQLKS